MWTTRVETLERFDERGSHQTVRLTWARSPTLAVNVCSALRGATSSIRWSSRGLSPLARIDAEATV